MMEDGHPAVAYQDVCHGHLQALLAELAAHAAPARHDQMSALRQLAAALGDDEIAALADKMVDAPRASAVLP